MGWQAQGKGSGEGTVGISEMQLCLIRGQGWRAFLVGGACMAGEALSGTKAADD